MPAPPRMTDRLAEIELFAGLSGEQLAWLAEAGVYKELADGEMIFREGQVAEAFFVLLDGELVISKDVGGREEVLARHLGGGMEHQFTGELPLLTGGDYLASAVAVGSAQVMVYDRAAFFDMMERCPQVCRVLLPVLAMRINGMERQAGHSHMLQGLGMLAAGLAHELNNPAAAAVRATGELKSALPDLEAAAMSWGELSDEGERRLVERLRAAHAHRDPQDALAAADAVDEIETWLDEHDLLGEKGDEFGVVLAEHGTSGAVLDGLAARVRPEALGPAVAYLAMALQAGALAEDAAEAGQRVVELVRRTAAYTNLDRAPEREVDLREGLEATLALMAPRLRGISVRRDYGCVPSLKVFPGDLNQVWTNLIDNAVDAMGGTGELTISTRCEGGHAAVEIRDTGQGIPSDVLPRVFQPFFTTKDVGKGTGLGLHLSMDIVTRRHGGTMEATSVPGDTRFVVRLPLG